MAHVCQFISKWNTTETALVINNEIIKVNEPALSVLCIAIPISRHVLYISVFSVSNYNNVISNYENLIRKYESFN